jgi:ketosteroid isomerase-like protein
MSARNKAVVQDALRHLNETGEPAWDLYSDDVTFTTRGGLGGGRESFHGHAGLQRGLGMFRDVWAQGMLSLELREVLGEGDRVVVVVRAHVRASPNEAPLEVEESWATWVRDGRIARIEQYGTRDEALRATGLG